MVDYMNARGNCPECGEFLGWADNPDQRHVCKKNNFLWNIHVALMHGGIKPESREDRRFLALALCGEVGELANLVKKDWRGDVIDGLIEKIEDEVGDIYAYLELFCMAYNIRKPSRILDEVTLPKIRARWPDKVG